MQQYCHNTVLNFRPYCDHLTYIITVLWQLVMWWTICWQYCEFLTVYWTIWLINCDGKREGWWHLYFTPIFITGTQTSQSFAFWPRYSYHIAHNIVKTLHIAAILSPYSDKIVHILWQYCPTYRQGS